MTCVPIGALIAWDLPISDDDHILYLITHDYYKPTTENEHILEHMLGALSQYGDRGSFFCTCCPKEYSRGRYYTQVTP